MIYTEEDYKRAISFALNNPPEIRAWKYDQGLDLFYIEMLETDGILHTINLQGWFIRKCLKWTGQKKWIESRTKPEKD